MNQPKLEIGTHEDRKRAANVLSHVGHVGKSRKERRLNKKIMRIRDKRFAKQIRDMREAYERNTRQEG